MMIGKLLGIPTMRDRGSGTWQIPIPNAPTIVSPESNWSANSLSDIEVAWIESEHADFYDIHLYADSGGEGEISISGGTGITGTSISIPCPPIKDGPYTLELVATNVSGSTSSSVEFYVTPAAAGTMFLWLQADYGTYQDSAGTLPAGETGDPVGKWLDRSGQLNHGMQVGGTSLKLRILENAINGRPALKPDGVDDVISIPHSASLLPPALQMYVVFESPTGTGAFRVLSKDGDTGYRLYRDAVNTNLRMNIALSPDTQIASPPTGWMIARIKYNRARIAFKATGRPEVTRAHTAALSGTGALLIPYSGTDKPIYALLAYATELGVTQQAAIEAYLATVTGLSV